MGNTEVNIPAASQSRAALCGMENRQARGVHVNITIFLIIYLSS
jgi:hypothetical protein